MKICVIDAFPSLPYSAEREFIRRLQIVGQRLGIEIIPVVTSSSIEAHRPDFVLATHEFSAKLTSFPTYGALWSPPKYFEGDIVRMRNIFSYDGYVIGSDCVRTFLNESLSAYPYLAKPISDFCMLPTCPAQPQLDAVSQDRSLIYSGVHWDGDRHRELFLALHKSKQINLYGPRKAWKHLRHSYRGVIPFDGDSLFSVIAKHGISLCIHRDEHIESDTPSMRLFEAASVGSLIIADHIPFARREFGDSIFHLDPHFTDAEKAAFIASKITWARDHPREADEMAQASRQIFEARWSLDILLLKLIDFHCSAFSGARDLYSSVGTTSVSTKIDVIIRCGSRPIETIQRSVNSVLAQMGVNPRVLLVDFSDNHQIEILASSYGERVVYVKSRRSGFRSTALWDGLANVSADYFALLDDDDTVQPSHWHQLISALRYDLDYEKRLFAYSGVIRVEEDGAYVSAAHHVGSLGTKIEECRELYFMDRFDLDRLLIYDNYIQSNAWVANRALLDAIDFSKLDDPRLLVAEDVYLYLLFLSVTDFLPVFVQTANWHWRSKSGENSMIAVDQMQWHAAIQQALTSLDSRPFRGTTYREARLAAQRRIADRPSSIYIPPNSPSGHPVKQLISTWLRRFPRLRAGLKRSYYFVRSVPSRPRA